MAHVLRGVDYRKDRRVRHNIVVRWREGLPKKRDEPWYLMTALDDRAERLCGLYGRRMSIEELSRDGKGRRNGQSLRDTRFRHPDRFDRFLISVALAYILLVGLGLRAKLDHDPNQWSTNRRAGECSAFTIGRAMLGRTNYLPEHLLKMVRAATIQVGKQWG